MNLAADFEAELRESMLDSVEHELVGKQGNLVFQAIQRSHNVLREYGRRHDYEVEPIIESLGQVELDRTDQSITARWGWQAPAAPFFALGTSDHVADGDPLVFQWPDAPDEVAQQFEDTFPTVFFSQVEVSGLPESRFVREALLWLRREIA